MRIKSNETLELFHNGKWQSLNLGEWQSNKTKPLLIFTDLETWGVFIIWFCLNNKLAPSNITAYKGAYYAIYIENIVIKCYKQFDCPLIFNTDNPEALLIWLKELNGFINQNLNTSLYDFKVNSIASLAMLFVQQQAPHILITLPDDMNEFIKKAYFGGRCELLRPGSHEFSASFDFPSMYGRLLLDNFPNGFSWVPYLGSSPTGGLPQGFIEADVNITIGNSGLAVLPYRHDRFGVVYPEGCFKGVFWYEELELLKKYNRGYVHKIYNILYASPDTLTCRSLINWLLELRQSKDLFAKKIINSIYGRLAIKPTKTRLKFLLAHNTPQLLLNSRTSLTYWRNLVIFEEELMACNLPKGNLALAVILASRARVKLFCFARDKAVEGEVLYVDTDEIFIKPYNFHEFSTTHADWKFYKTLEFFCERNYNFKCMSGVETSRGSITTPKGSFHRKNISLNETQPHTFR